MTAVSPKYMPRPQPSNGPPRLDKPKVSEGAAALRHMAHQRLDELFDYAEQCAIYGRVGIEVSFERGVPNAVHRNFGGTDRPT